MNNTNLIPHSKPTIRKHELKNTLECMITDYIGPGNLVLEFEKKLATYLSTPFTKAVSSGTMAFFLILKLLGIGEDDEIILPSYAPHILLNPIYYLKAKPVLVDINEHDFSPSIADIGEKLTEKTKAILIVHLFGKPVQVEPYRQLGLPVIEDSAQALGAQLDETKCGNMADYSFFSFYATKMISSGGVGGAIVSKEEDDLQKLNDLINRDDREEFSAVYPFFMSDIQAAMGITQLEQINEFINYRQKIANFYNQKLIDAGKEVPDFNTDSNRIFYRYLMKTNDLPIEETINIFKNYNIEIKKPIYKPLHRYLKEAPMNYPNSEKIFNEYVSLPIYPTLKKADAELVAKVATKI